MTTQSKVFEETYRHYLSLLKAADLKTAAPKLGAETKGGEAVIPIYGRPHRVSAKGVVDFSGNRPSLDICVILCRYILMCPQDIPRDGRWASFRDLKDSGPLTTYYRNDVEGAIKTCFSGKMAELKRAGEALGGYRPTIDLQYDFSMQFDALPRIPVLLLLNDADEEFPAHCSVLLERRAEAYLDAECLAILARLLAANLKKRLKNACRTAHPSKPA